MTAARPGRSKAVATWLAFIGGGFGLHRFYLHGARDPLGWLHPWPTLAGLYGVWRMRAFGVDDRLAWLLAPILGVMLATTMLVAIVHGLTSDERWDARHNPAGPPTRTGWVTVIGVVLALAIGAGVLMATVAFVSQRAFEAALEPEAPAQRSTASPTQ